MQFLPTLKIGLLNGWLLLVMYFLSLTLMVLTYQVQTRCKLFYEPAYPHSDPRWFLILFDRIAATAFVVLMVFT